MKYTKERAAFIFGREMLPCPKCGSYRLGYQTPIQMELTGEETTKQILGKWARATKEGATPLQGPVFLWCQDCHHKGPAVDCSGRTSEDVGRDPVVANKVKNLWNGQERT